MQSDPASAVNSQSSAANLAAVVATLANVKPGFRTSEFFITVAGQLGILLASLLGALSPWLAAPLIAVANVAYHFLRAWQKDNQHGFLADLAQSFLDHAEIVQAPAAAAPARIVEHGLSGLDGPIGPVGIPGPIGAVGIRGAVGPSGFITPGLCIVAAAVSAIVILLTGCLGSGVKLKLPKTKVTYHSEFGSVSYDGKTLTTDFNGGEVAPGLSVEGGGKF